jgi:hypothetical protein
MRGERRGVLLSHLRLVSYADTNTLADLIQASWASAHDELTRMNAAGLIWMMRTGDGPWLWAAANGNAP